MVHSTVHKKVKRKKIGCHANHVHIRRRSLYTIMHNHVIGTVYFKWIWVVELNIAVWQWPLSDWKLSAITALLSTDYTRSSLLSLSGKQPLSICSCSNKRLEISFSFSESSSEGCTDLRTEPVNHDHALSSAGFLTLVFVLRKLVLRSYLALAGEKYLLRHSEHTDYVCHITGIVLVSGLFSWATLQFSPLISPQR